MVHVDLDTAERALGTEEEELGTPSPQPHQQEIPAPDEVHVHQPLVTNRESADLRRQAQDALVVDGECLLHPLHLLGPQQNAHQEDPMIDVHPGRTSGTGC
jgi:hypothetical protein